MENAVRDVVVVGAGPIGASLALGLSRLGLDTVLVDARDASQAKAADGRNYAVVTGSWNLLNRLGVTDELSGQCQTLRGLEAVDGGSHVFGAPSVLFEGEDAGTGAQDQDGHGALGYMVMANPLQAALDRAMAEADGIDWRRSTLFEALEIEPGFNRVTLSGGEIIETRLLIGCDGMRSPVRDALGITTEGRDYNTSVLTANVALDRPHDGIARQLFTPEGPFATLPLQGNRANLAWYMKRGAAEALVALGEAAVEAELNARFADFAGQMSVEGRANSYPLVLQLARALTGPRAALVGDAVRRVNPLAGQGLNQGFRDVAALLDVIEDALRTGLDIGAPSVLERYSQARHFDGHSSAVSLDMIDRLFSNDAALTKPVRTAGLLGARLIAPLRRGLARKASATEAGAPRWMRPL